MTIQEYYHKLETHDWFHFYSDDARVYRRGHDALAMLEREAKTDPAKQELFDGFKEHHFSGVAFNKPKAPLPPRPAN